MEATWILVDENEYYQGSVNSEMTGACIGFPMSQMSIEGWYREKLLSMKIPEIVSVESAN